MVWQDDGCGRLNVVADVAQLVERNLAKVGVTSSSFVVRSLGYSPSGLRHYASTVAFRGFESHMPLSYSSNKETEGPGKELQSILI